MNGPYKNILTEKRNRVLTVTLNRPQVRNAFNEELIVELTTAMANEAMECDVRVVVLKGAGQVFSAGGDLNWLKKTTSNSRTQNIRDGERFFDLLHNMNTLKKPLIGSVHGAVLGGGMGLVSVCDYVTAERETQFGFTEVSLGLIPAVIGPFVFNKLGASHTRALFLTAKRFGAEKALAIGLIHEVVDTFDELNRSMNSLAESAAALSPHAIKTAKLFLHFIGKHPSADNRKKAVQTLADLRASPEGKEGIEAFLEKRRPKW